MGNEVFQDFSPASDVFSLDANVFGVGNNVNFVNTTADNIPSDGVNVVVLETFDNDNNPLTPFGAGNAADLIADAIKRRVRDSSSTSTRISIWPAWCIPPISASATRT